MWCFIVPGGGCTVVCTPWPSDAICLGLCGSGGASASSLCSRILSVVSCPCWTRIVVGCSCEGEPSQEGLTSPWWCHSPLLSLLVRTRILLDQSFTLMTSVYLQKGPTSKYSHTEGWGFNIWILGRHKHSFPNKGEFTDFAVEWPSGLFLEKFYDSVFRSFL